MIEYHEYFVEAMIRDKQDRFAAQAARRALLRTLAPPRRSPRVRLGLALIRAGRWLRGHGREWAAERRPLA
jgi:hypothetical protein